MKRSKTQQMVIMGIFGIMITAIIYMMFNGGLVPETYLGDFTLNELCAFSLIVFTILSILWGITK